MILVRGKSSGTKVARTLLDFKQSNDEPRYSFDVMTQEALIIGSAPIVKFIIAILGLAVNPNNPIALALYYRYGNDERTFGEPLSEEELLFLQSIRQLSPEAAFERIVMRYNLDERVEDTAYIQALHEHIVSFCITKVADISLFLKWWEECGSKKSISVEQSERTIEITTIHKAKGLEKPVIIIPYCDWELDPRISRGSITNYIWAKAEGDEDIARIGKLPINTKKIIQNSYFAADYYREKVYSHIDNINLLYVALTRAAESLHIFTKAPSDKGNSNDNVGALLLSTLAGMEYKRDKEGCIFYEFGEFSAPCARNDGNTHTKHHTLETYHTSVADMRLRLPSQRYFEESECTDISPRSFGILMHRAFAEAKTIEDIYEGIKQMERDAVISPTEGEHLREEVGKVLENPTITEWFSEEWSEVRNENDIIVPRSATVRRPDRVMIKGRKAVVVDYKFGDEELKKYTTQISDYMSILARIGYTPVEGYIRYVKLGKVVEVK
jgi:ATP-dependent exoDNAse (exonuclease V) beta subunit